MDVCPPRCGVRPDIEVADLFRKARADSRKGAEPGKTLPGFRLFRGGYGPAAAYFTSRTAFGHVGFTSVRPVGPNGVAMVLLAGSNAELGT